MTSNSTADPTTPTRRDRAPAPEVLSTLRDRLTGSLAMPGEAGYELAQPWNRAVTVTPRAVVIAADAHDIAETVRFARAHHLRVAVQATGHGAVPLDGDVLLIHTARLDECTVHPEQRWARIGAGVRWQQVLDAAAPYRLTPVTGAATNIGVVGYLSGGGLGPLAATYGVSSDHVKALDVVTGDGELRRATPTEHPDLFWGLRGGKATLGIITAVEIDLIPLHRVYGGALYFGAADVATVLHAWAAWSADLPRYATTSAALLRLPALPRIPPPLAGRTTIAVRYTSVADPAHAEIDLTPIRAVATAVLDSITEIPCAQIGHVHADPTDPTPAHENSTLLADLPTEAVTAILDAAGPSSGSQLLLVELRRFGGAIAQPPKHPSAFCHRDAAYGLSTVGVTLPPHDQTIAAHADAARVISAAAPWSTGGKLINFAANGDPTEIARCYNKDTLHRLAVTIQVVMLLSFRSSDGMRRRGVWLWGRGRVGCRGGRSCNAGRWSGVAMSSARLLVVAAESTSTCWPMTVPGQGKVASLSKATSNPPSCSSWS